MKQGLTPTRDAGLLAIAVFKLFKGVVLIALGLGAVRLLNPVTVHRLFYPGTVEEVIDQRSHRKRQIAGTAVIGTEGTGEDLADVMAALNMSPMLKGKS